MTAARAAMHIHSEWSYDADWPLDRLAEAFRRRRYDIVLLCEHDQGFDPDRWAAYQQACAQASGDDLLLVPGIEYSDPENVVHVPVWGPLDFQGEALSTVQLLDQLDGAPAFTVFAHPTRRDAHVAIDPDLLDRFSAIEVWNRKYDGVAANPLVARHWRELGLVPTASLDFHRSRQFFPAAVRIDVPRLDRDLVEDALCARAIRAEVFRVPIERLLTGAPATALAGLEGLRPKLLRLARGPRVRRLQRRRQP